MCGIVGVLTKDWTAKHMKIGSQLLYVDALRGIDSTGVALVNPKGEVEVHKKAMCPADFLSLKRVTKAVENRYNHRAFIGHNRFATHGDVNNTNAHPFQHGNITLVHNGGLLAGWKQSLPKGHDFEVDSEAIAYSVDTIGIHETLKKLEGAFCLVYHDAGDNTINMVRNEKRPMTFAVTEDDSIIFASEEQSISWIAARNNMEIQTFYDLTPQLLVSFNLDTKGKLEDYEAEEVEFYVAPKSHRGTGTHGKATSTTNTGSTKDTTTKHLPQPHHKKRKSQEEIADDLGVRLGQEVEFQLFDQIAYRDDIKSDVVFTGCLSVTPFYNVNVHRCRPDEFDDDGEVYVGKVISIETVNRDGKNAIVDHALCIDPNTIKPADVRSKAVEEVKEKEAKIAEKKSKRQSGSTKGKRLEKKKQKQKKKAQTKDKNEGGKIILPSGMEGSDDAPFLLDSEPRLNREVSYLFLNGPNGIAVSAKDWDEMTRYGCSQCSGNLMPYQHEYILWVDTNTPLCPICADKWTSDQYSEHMN